MANTVVWFDIPVKDIDRACKFYSFLLGANLKKEEYASQFYVPFPHKDDEASGCLVEDKAHTASDHAVLIYLNLDSKLDHALSQIEEQGGKILTPKEKIGPWGYRAIILDSEKNKIALHSYS